jgi:glycine/D-amino acid oxidase-like deaminating enzyme
VTARHLDQLAGRSLADARPTVFWTDRPDAPQPTDPLVGRLRADLAVIGGGLTGLWAAILAKEEDPSADVVLLEARTVAHGASGRNGGFISGSLTHGLSHGVAMWPRQIETLLRLGRQNLAQIEEFVARHGIDADLRLCGKTTVAVKPHQVALLREATRLHGEHGEEAEFLHGDAMRAEVTSPTYLAGMRVRSNYGLIDPARLCWGLLRVARQLGVRVHEGSHVARLERSGGGIGVRTAAGTVEARRVVVATNAYPAPLRRLRNWVLPVYDHVLVTEPLGEAALASLGWRENQGVSDAGNQFHYYRRTPDDRILWGGYDAIYYFGGRIETALEQREASHRMLAEHFFETFPQLEDIRFTHRWAGVIDSTTRFTPLFGTAFGGRLAYSVGYTGLGVGSSRFGAQVALDLVNGRRTERTRLDMVRKRPMPFPPEPLRWAVVQATRSALARQDRNGGRRGPWLRILDRFGVGFNS